MFKNLINYFRKDSFGIRNIYLVYKSSKSHKVNGGGGGVEGEVRPFLIGRYQFLAVSTPRKKY